MLGALRGGAESGKAREQHEGRHAFDKGIRPEADKGYRLGYYSCPDGYRCLDRMPAEPEPREKLRPLYETLAVGLLPLVGLAGQCYRPVAHARTFVVLSRTASSNARPSQVRA